MGKAQDVYTANDVCGAAVTAWRMALQGVTVRNIVRDTDRVPRLRDEPPSGNRSHRYTAAEVVRIVDGLAERGRTRGLSADALLTALSIPVSVRQAARKALDAERGRKAGAARATRNGTPSRSGERPSNPLGKRAVRVKPEPDAAPSA